MQANGGAKKRVLIVGGGFAGMYAALELDKRLARRADVSVTMVDRQNFFLFTPMLHEVAASDLDITSIVNPMRELLKHVTFLQGDVTQIDLASRRVVLQHCGGTEHGVLEYDYLLLCPGATTNFYNLPGLSENARTMSSLRDAVELRNALIESLEEAEVDCVLGDTPLLTYVVAGGGFAGVETLAAMNDFVRECLRFYPHLNEEMVRVVLVHDGDYILPELGAELGQYAKQELEKRKVEIVLKTKVTGYGEEGVQLADGRSIRPVVFVWTAGVTANPLVRTLPCQTERGRLLANEFMEVPDHANLWACGDCAYIVDPKTNKPYPPTAQHASRMGKVVGQNIEAAICGGTKKPFVYSSQGALAAIGRRTGVALIMGMKFSGVFAWMLWRAIYLAKLPRLEKKIRVVAEWTMNLLFPKDIVQFMSLNAPLVQNTLSSSTARNQSETGQTVEPGNGLLSPSQPFADSGEVR
ncbi:MAG TPA: NAD(P)/FAD-dependent oxidoreductase [Planktothrix sp.]|jgi:NADH dehydrogenase